MVLNLKSKGLFSPGASCSYLFNSEEHSSKFTFKTFLFLSHFPLPRVNSVRQN